MKTPIRRVVISVIVAAAACGPGADRDASGHADPKAAVRAMTDRGWSEGDVSVFQSTIADSVRFHYTSAPPRWMTRRQMSDVVLRWREAFPDLRMEVEEMIGEGSLVAARMTLSGTHRDEWAGADSTGRAVEMALMMFFRFENGRMVELWEVDDQLGFRRQLGVLPGSDGG